MFSCGGIDSDAYSNTYELPKILLKTALQNEACIMGMTASMDKAVRNLSHF